MRQLPIGALLQHQHELVRVLDRQRPEEEIADDGEDRGVGADPEREREHRRRRETTVLDQDSPAVTPVLPQVPDQMFPLVGSEQEGFWWDWPLDAPQFPLK
jgi:hypothetical protein